MSTANRSSLSYSIRRKSMVYRSPILLDSDKDIRKVAFYLAITAIIIGFISWIFCTLSLLIFTNQCQLFHPNGKITISQFLYCSTIDLYLMDNNNNNLFCIFIICIITSLLPNVFGTFFTLIWKSKLSDLYTVLSQQRSIIINTININSFTNIRKIISWILIILSLLICLIIEYLINEKIYFINKPQPGGRYVYCLIVIFVGVGLFKIIEYITNWEFKIYFKRFPDDEQLIISEKRTALFHRDLTIFMINTTLGVLLPIINVYGGDKESISEYILSLNNCIMEATGFIWSACISSQTTALIIEIIIKKYNFSFMKKRKNVYVTHENWFILLVLFLWQCQWGWLNVQMYLMGSFTILYVLLIYKIRFLYIKPEIEKQFICNLVKNECFLYIIYLFIPTQIVILIKIDLKLLWIPSMSLIITIINHIFYKLYLRPNRMTPYLVSVEKQWNMIENKLNDTNGIRSVNHSYNIGR